MTPTPDQREKALEAVKLWRETLEGLKQSAFENNDSATYASSCKNLSIYDTIEAALTAPPQVPQSAIDKLHHAKAMCENHWSTSAKRSIEEALAILTQGKE